LGRGADPELVVEVLGDAEAILASPTEADVILRVDSERGGFGTIVHALAGFRGQAPHLAAGYRHALREARLRPDLALTRDVAVALAVVGGYAGAEPVHFVVAAQLHFVAAAFGEEGETGLPAGGVEFG